MQRFLTKVRRGSVDIIRDICKAGTTLVCYPRKKQPLIQVQSTIRTMKISIRHRQLNIEKPRIQYHVAISPLDVQFEMIPQGDSEQVCVNGIITLATRNSEINTN